MKETENILAKNPAFSSLSEDELNRLMQIANERVYEKGETIFKENSISNSLYIIKSGELEISKISSEKGMGIAILTEGSIFGEMSFIDNKGRSATAITNCQSTLWEVSKSDFDTFVKENPYCGFKIMCQFAKVSISRLRLMNDEVVKQFASIYSNSPVW